MMKAFKFRIYPNKGQRELIDKTFGCTRFVYNHFLDRRIHTYEETGKSLTFVQCSKELTALKKECEWLKEVDSSALVQALRNLDRAFNNFFKGQNKYPKFKSKKDNRKSYRTCGCVHFGKLGDSKIQLPKLGSIKCKGYKQIEGRIVSATVSKDPSERYYVSLCCDDIDIQPLPKTDKSIGIDLGIKEFCITSDGITIDNPKYLKSSLKKLARLQRELSHKSKGSANWNKARIKLAKQYAKVTNQRKDFLQKLSTNIIKDNDIVCMEDLSIKDMLQNHKLARSISDVSWYEFVRELQYKADWYGKLLTKIDQYYPSSQTCHICGYINKDTKNLGVREWTCPSCNTHHDRDINAAINIKNEGLRQLPF